MSTAPTPATAGEGSNPATGGAEAVIAAAASVAAAAAASPAPPVEQKETVVVVEPTAPAAATARSTTVTRSAALCMGINYTGTTSQLQGCVNDAENLAELLQAVGAVPKGGVKLLREPKGAAIVQEIKTLSKRSWDENLEYVLISYSGHGTQVQCYLKDEADGQDEAICPADYDKEGVITDDTLRSLLAAFNPKTIVCFICDACHSGSMLDLKMTYTSKYCTLESSYAPIPARVVMLSGCLDIQTSADSYDTLLKEFTGAMTSSLLAVLSRDERARTDVFRLVAEMRKDLRVKGFAQKPLLSSSFVIPPPFAFIPHRR